MQSFSFEISNDAVAVTSGVGKVTYRIPIPFVPAEVRGGLTVPQASGALLTVDIKRNGSSILSTPLTVNNGSKTSVGATAACALVSGTEFAPDDELTIDVTQIGDGTAKGLKITLLGYQSARALATQSGTGTGGTSGTATGPTETLVDRTTGTPYGNMTVLGGLPAAFDGLTNVGASQCAAIAGGPGYVGQSFAAAKVFSKAVLYGRNDAGFIDGADPSMTVTFYGKNGVPTGPTDGVVLGSLTFTDTSNESAGRTISLNANGITCDHIHAYINGGAYSTYCGELSLFELK